MSELPQKIGKYDVVDVLGKGSMGIVYRGHDAVTDDIDESSTLNNEPLSTTAIAFDSESGLYVYEAAFLPLGDYTLAFTCNADDDDNDEDDSLPFFNVQNVSVMVNDTTFLKP